MNDISELKSTIRFEQPKNVGFKTLFKRAQNSKQISKAPEHTKKANTIIIKKYIDEDKENIRDFQGQNKAHFNERSNNQESKNQAINCVKSKNKT